MQHVAAEELAEEVRVAGNELDALYAINFAYFGYRCLEIWQRLIPLSPHSIDFDRATLCYARLVKLVSTTDLHLEPEELAPATHVACNALFHLSMDRPAVAVRLLESVAEHLFSCSRVLAWYSRGDTSDVALCTFVSRFQDLATSFYPAAIRLWPMRPQEDEDSIDREWKFFEQLARLQLCELELRTIARASKGTAELLQASS